MQEAVDEKGLDEVNHYKEVCWPGVLRGSGIVMMMGRWFSVVHCRWYRTVQYSVILCIAVQVVQYNTVQCTKVSRPAHCTVKAWSS